MVQGTGHNGMCRSSFYVFWIGNGIRNGKSMPIVQVSLFTCSRLATSPQLIKRFNSDRLDVDVIAGGGAYRITFFRRKKNHETRVLNTIGSPVHFKETSVFMKFQFLCVFSASRLINSVYSLAYWTLNISSVFNARCRRKKRKNLFTEWTESKLKLGNKQTM